MKHKLLLALLSIALVSQSVWAAKGGKPPPIPQPNHVVWADANGVMIGDAQDKLGIGDATVYFEVDGKLYYANYVNNRGFTMELYYDLPGCTGNAYVTAVTPLYGVTRLHFGKDGVFYAPSSGQPQLVNIASRLVTFTDGEGQCSPTTGNEPTPPTEGGLLTNPGYELPDASTGDIACSFSWDCFNESFTNSNLFDDGNGGPPAHSGTQVLKQFNLDGGAFQEVPVIPGQTYTASAWAQNWSGDPLNRFVLLRLWFFDSDGNDISGGLLQETGSPVSGGTETFLPPDTWVQLSASGVAPANAATAHI